jgi:hypothetical protein
MAKITKATFKSFINKNRNKLFIRCESSFDGMTDCVQHELNPQFVPVQASDRISENNHGIQGVWLVGNSRDYFSEYRANDYQGIYVYNSCGSFTVATKN